MAQAGTTRLAATGPIGVFALTLVALAGLLASIPDSAQAAGSCLTLSASRDTVQPGESLRLQGRACAAASGDRIRLVAQRGERRGPAGGARLAQNGRFSHRLQIPASWVDTVSIRALMPGFASASVRVRVASDGEMVEDPSEGPIEPKPGATVPTPVHPPSPAPDSSPSGDCELSGSQPSSSVAMSVAGCRLIASDTGTSSDPTGFWGDFACQNSSRVQQLSGGADPHATALGQPQPDSSFRRTTVLDGDDSWGERCELGLNDHHNGPTAFYREGQRRVTFLSMRLPSNYPLESGAWQSVMQMKQAQPADGGGDVPILMMDAMNNSWYVDSYQGIHWTFPAQRNVWTRFAYDVFYSRDASRGWLQVSADLNADGDFGDSRERSPVIRTATLKTEISGPNGTSDGLAPGDSIPSHLRVGVYHNPSIACPPPGGCSAEVDNIQVIAP